MVKPSSPTPPHLRTLKLSYIDQLFRSAYISFIYFYNNPTHDQTIPNDDDDLNRTSRLLSESLSRALTSFYPLAGRLLDSSTVDCNDAGAELSFACVLSRRLDEAVLDPDDVEHYLPVGPTAMLSSNPLFLARVSFFPCGGVAIGIRFSHNVSDCASVAAFVEAWASRRPRPLSFDFDLSSYFPAREELREVGVLPDTTTSEIYRTKRFEFDEAKMAALRRRVGSSVGSTRVELVSAFVLESLLQVFSSSRKVVLASHAVNLRPRKKALENMFGNCIMTSFAYCSAGKDSELHELVGKLRESIRKVDEGYIAGSENGGDVYMGDLYKALSILAEGETEACLFTSWCGFPFYEADFGWGRPVRVCPTALAIRNGAIFVDMNRLDEGDNNNSKGKGIEAWVSMADDGLKIFEKNFELISDEAKDAAENAC
ncbi:HXXXD-type acyl-transferase family protein [Striga hermonthica]|uniref:HXXXD-type acyl-transferase family protein n=1 Tax=Striga hermonthica TaxID=68872 RepID=A0A9N7NMR5_STRHE|nr:HXXXD-type acyl-transferase family protein [Striga hermonthica]